MICNCERCRCYREMHWDRDLGEEVSIEGNDPECLLSLGEAYSEETRGLTREQGMLMAIWDKLSKIDARLEGLVVTLDKQSEEIRELPRLESKRERW